MKYTFGIPSARIVVDFYQLRSDYAERRLESLRRMYNEACILFDRHDYHDALLCFCFIRTELDKIISSCDSFLDASLIDMFVRIENCISECMHKLSNSGEN